MRSIAFPLRRRWPRSSLLAFAAAGICATVAFGLVEAQASRLEALTRTGPVAVVVAARDLEAGSSLQIGDVALAESLDPPPAAIGAAEAAVGTTLVAPIAAGEPITSTRLSRSALGSLVPPGRMITQVDATNVPAGLVPGDRVDVFATFAGARPYTSLVGHDLRVLRVVDGSTGLDGSASVGVLLDVDATAARTLAGAAATATLTLAVYGPSANPSTPG